MEAGCTREAVDMYNNAGKWEMAHKVILFCFLQHLLNITQI